MRFSARKRRHPKWLIIDGRPCPYDVAPYVWLVLRKAGQTASAIYRGSDPLAVRILHKFGGHTQRELYYASPSQRRAWGVRGTPNKPGFSQHELRSDGQGNPHVPAGQPLQPWQVGIDSGADSSAAKAAINAAAAHYGLSVRHPYSSGIEAHHWCFAIRPHPNKRLRKARVVAVRLRLRIQTRLALR